MSAIISSVAYSSKPELARTATLQPSIPALLPPTTKSATRTKVMEKDTCEGRATNWFSIAHVLRKA